MRAFLTKCLLVVTLVAVSGSAEGQLTQLSGFKRVPPHQRQVPHGPNVRHVQFEELLPASTVPSATTEANPYPSGIELGPVADPVLEIPIEPTTGQTAGNSSEPSENTVHAQPVISESIDGDVILGSGIGQPYDLSIADVVPEAGPEVYSTNNWFRGGRWYSKQEFIMLLRTDLPPVHVSVDSTSTRVDGRPVLDPFIAGAISTKDADFTYEAGTRLSFGKILGRDVANRDHGLEFTFFGLFDYTGRASLTPADIESGTGIWTLLGSLEAQSLISGGFGFPIINAVPGFTDSVTQNILYQADLNSFELNYMIGGRPARDRMVMQPDGRWTKFATPSSIRAFYAGMRYIRQNELFHHQAWGNNQLSPIFDDDGVTVIGTFSDPTDEAGNYRVTTDNDMFGFQFGGDVVQKRTDWAVGLNGKIGGLVNFANRRSTLYQRFDNPNDPNDNDDFTRRSRAETLNDETLTVLGEANAYVAYYLRPNTSIRVGYNVLFLNGLATATDNLGIYGDEFPKFELTGNAFYHGMNCGFEMTW